MSVCDAVPVRWMAPESLQHFERHHSNPVTGARLPHSNLVPNLVLRKLVEDCARRRLQRRLDLLKAAAEERAMWVNLVIKNSRTSELVHFKVKRSIQCRKIFSEFCQRQNCDVRAVRFLFDSATIRPDCTPDELDMEDSGFSQLIAGKINANVDRCSLDSQDKANSINYVKSSVLAHFAAGGSSNAVILDAHVAERENQFLAAEADDEAAEDLCYALERFLEGMEEYETIVRRVSQHAASIPFVCSLLFCV